jgi:hypothetical protein
MRLGEHDESLARRPSPGLGDSRDDFAGPGVDLRPDENLLPRKQTIGGCFSLAPGQVGAGRRSHLPPLRAGGRAPGSLHGPDRQTGYARLVQNVCFSTTSEWDASRFLNTCTVSIVSTYLKLIFLES